MPLQNQDAGRDAPPPAMTSFTVTDGRDAIGLIIKRGRHSFEAITPEDVSLGVFRSAHRATDRLSERWARR
jgi:hypothetical protein